MRERGAAALLTLALLSACTGVVVEHAPGDASVGTAAPPHLDVDSGAAPARTLPLDGMARDGAGSVDPRPYPRPCPDIYDDDLLAKFELTLPPESFDKLRDIFTNFKDRSAQGVDLRQYVDGTMFRYGVETYTGIQVRLKGSVPFGWEHSKGKMQFVVKFPKEHLFHGVRRLNLDGPEFDYTFLRERLATHYAHDVGVVASCVNNARLFINDAYYGFYVNIEHPDEMFLARNFPDPGGNLWKNTFTPDDGSLEEGVYDGDVFELRATLNVPGLKKIGDLDQWVTNWAFEANVAYGDNYWCRGHNYATYHDPVRGWLWLLSDNDAAWTSYNISEALICSPVDPIRRPIPHFELLTADPTYRQRYKQAIRAHLAKYDVALFKKRLDTWNAQIAEYAERDPIKPFKDAAERNAALVQLGDFIQQRHDFVEQMLKAP